MRSVCMFVVLVAPLFASTYEDPAGKFRFDLPSGWTARVRGQLPGETPLHLAKGDFSCDLTVVASNEGGSLEDALAEVLPNLRDQGDVAQTEVKVDDLAAARLELTPSDEGRDLAIVLVVASGGGRFTVELAASREAYRRDRARFDEVLAAFHLGAAKEASAGFDPDLEVKDDGTTLVAGSPPLTWRVVSGCLGAVELAYDIELTEGEKESLAKAIVLTFKSQNEERRRSLLDLSEEAWSSRGVSGDDLVARVKRIRTGISEAGPRFADQAAEIARSDFIAVGPPSAHDTAAFLEWAQFALNVLSGGESISLGVSWSRWGRKNEVRIDVEWMALRAAYQLASVADRKAYRDRLIAALDGAADLSWEHLSTARDEEVPSLATKLHEAAQPLIDTLSPKVDLTHPSANGEIRYRY